MQPLKSPLNLYIIWNPDFKRGIDYANFLYSEFCRDYLKPLNRGIGIHIFFRSVVVDDDKPLAIDFNKADRNAVVVLVDDEMFESDTWTNYFKDVANDAATNKRIYPVALSKYAYDVAHEIKNQFIRLQDIVDLNETIEFERRCKRLRSELLQDLSRLLLNMSSSYDASQDFNPPPIKIFISHAKKDGETIAIDFRNYIRSETKLNSFFDANDIANGYDFEQQIAVGIEGKNSILVVFQTDAYSTREWCRIEIITAKRYKSPIVIVNAILNGEARSFPYLGNVPTIRWNNNFNDIIDLALIQMLHNLYSEQVLLKAIKLYIPEPDSEIAYLTSPPELFNYLDIKKLKGKNDVLVLYPDPPLGNEELKLLNDLDEGVDFVTPIMLPKLNIE